MTLEEFVPAMQLAIGPVILISGVGLLLMVMTNRFARVMDRARETITRLREGESAHTPHLDRQLLVLLEQARLLRWAITLAVVSVLLCALLILALFAAALGRFVFVELVIGLFAGSLASLLASLVCLLRDMNRAQTAMELEIRDLPRPPPPPAGPAPRP